MQSEKSCFFASESRVLSQYLNQQHKHEALSRRLEILQAAKERNFRKAEQNGQHIEHISELQRSRHEKRREFEEFRETTNQMTDKQRQINRLKNRRLNQSIHDSKLATFEKNREMHDKTNNESCVNEMAYSCFKAALMETKKRNWVSTKLRESHSQEKVTTFKKSKIATVYEQTQENVSMMEAKIKNRESQIEELEQTHIQLRHSVMENSVLQSRSSNISRSNAKDTKRLSHHIHPMMARIDKALVTYMNLH